MNKERKTVLEEMKERGILSNCANEENLRRLENEKGGFYLGIDCTSDSIHIGHLLPIMQGIRLVKEGFKFFLMLGGATSKIGDPSDKLKERPILTNEEITKNQEKIETRIKEIFSRKEEITNFEGENKPLEFFLEKEKREEVYKILEIRRRGNEWNDFLWLIWPNEIESQNLEIINNNQWLNKLSFINFINSCGRKVTVNYLLSKETIKRRVESKNGISFSAFSYSLLQGYDFLHLYKEKKCYGQIGASDQWGNFTTGIKLINDYQKENKSWALSFNLILNERGEKISKSDPNKKTIWLEREKTTFKNLFNFFNNMDDLTVIEYVKKFTFIRREQLEKLIIINFPKSTKVLQKILIELFLFLIHGKEGLLWIEKNFKAKKSMKGYHLSDY